MRQKRFANWQCKTRRLCTRDRLSFFLVNDTSYRAVVLASVSLLRRRGRGSMEGAAQGQQFGAAPRLRCFPGPAATRREAESGHSSYHSGPYR